MLVLKINLNGGTVYVEDKEIVLKTYNKGYLSFTLNGEPKLAGVKDSCTPCYTLKIGRTTVTFLCLDGRAIKMGFEGKGIVKRKEICNGFKRSSVTK